MSFSRNNAGGDNRDSFSHYYVQIKDSNILIDGKSFFDMPVKNEEEAYENIVDISSNNDYTTGNLFDFSYFKKHYKLMAIDLSKQTELEDPHQINFIEKPENKDHGATIFFDYRKIRRNCF